MRVRVRVGGDWEDYMPRMEGREAFLGGSIFGKQARFQKRPRVPTF